MKGRKGFTVVELMVVMGLVAIMLAIGAPMLMKGLKDYRFYAATQAFENAASAIRVRALGGCVSYWVKKMQGSAGNSVFTVSPADFTFTLPQTSSSSPAEYPIKDTDYVLLTGFSDPTNLNDRVFEITSINWTGKVTRLSTTGGVDTWSVTNLSFACKSCDPDPDKSSSCMLWNSTLTTVPDPAKFPLGWTAGQEMGRVRVLPCLKFTDKFLDTDFVVKPYSRGRYEVSKELTGNSLECRYNPDLYQVTVNWTSASVATPKSLTRPILVFDSSGATRDHVTYIVEMRRLKSDKTPYADTALPPTVFSVTPSGRTRYGVQTN
jgi:prepilin-type N-terminal cleavage/methylation domain-containing protein